MSEECNKDCKTCTQSCNEKESLVKTPHERSSINKVIAVLSGKGGVGKSIVTSMLAVLMQRKGYSAAVMDLDITGPSIPRAFGLKQRVTATEDGLNPVVSETGIQIMSINLLLPNETDPVVWRGPVIANVATQFWTDVIWKNVDYMFIDMPPGTGDVALTTFQSIPLDGAVIVTSPQEIVSMVVEKAVNMAGMMGVSVLGLVENMSYINCPDCGKKIELFGKSSTPETAGKHGLDILGEIPIEPALAAAVDAGRIEDFKGTWLDRLAEIIEKP